MKIIEFLKKLFNRNYGGFLPSEQDERDFVLLGSQDILGAWSYIPKKQRLELPVLEERNQAGQNTCVAESIATQKETDEGVVLDPQDMAIYLRSTGEMNQYGTSLSAAQKALQMRGMAKKGFLPNNYFVSWLAFSDPKLMTEEIKQDAAIHKSQSFYKTFNLDKVLEELDNGRKGHTGLIWYSTYGRNYPYILPVYNGVKQYGHAFTIIGYDMNYNGEKVLICKNSFGKSWGDNGKFYIRFKDFSVLAWGVYFNSDLPKDVLGWLSIHQAQAVKEINGPKIYLIQGDYKRHIPDMPMLHMIGKLTSFIEDKDNVLPDVKTGEPISIRDISPDKVLEVREQVRILRDANFLKEEYKEYFPELFN